MSTHLKENINGKKVICSATVWKHNPKCFYKYFKRRKKCVKNNVNTEQIYEQFSNLVSSDIEYSDVASDHLRDYDNTNCVNTVFGELDYHISEQEIASAIDKLSTQKNHAVNECFIHLSKRFTNAFLCRESVPRRHM